MWEMALGFEERLKYVGNDVDLREIAKICGKWLNPFPARVYAVFCIPVCRDEF